MIDDDDRRKTAARIPEDEQITSPLRYVTSAKERETDSTSRVGGGGGGGC